MSTSFQITVIKKLFHLGSTIKNKQTVLTRDTMLLFTFVRLGLVIKFTLLPLPRAPLAILEIESQTVALA